MKMPSTKTEWGEATRWFNLSHRARPGRVGPYQTCGCPGRPIYWRWWDGATWGACVDTLADACDPNKRRPNRAGSLPRFWRGLVEEATQ